PTMTTRLSAAAALALFLPLFSAAQPSARPPLSVAGLAATFAGEEGLARVTVFLGIPGAELVTPAALERPARSGADGAKPDSGRQLRVVAEVRLEDASGSTADRFEVEAEVDLSREGERLAASSLKMYGDLLTVPGAHRLILEVRSGELRGSRDFPLDVPETPEGASRLLPPIFIDDIGEALVFYEGTGSEPPADYPFRVDDGFETFVPEIVPEITRDMPRSRVALLGYHLTGPQMLVDTGLIAADGRLLGKERLQLVGRSDTAPDGLDRLYFGLDTQGLDPGDYQLNVSLHNFSSGSTEQTAMPFTQLDR
ncbi:MAG: hypothetical protein AAF725_01155, partial [Acidobacteriota bacterium]